MKNLWNTLNLKTVETATSIVSPVTNVIFGWANTAKTDERREFFRDVALGVGFTLVGSIYTFVFIYEGAKLGLSKLKTWFKSRKEKKSK